MENYTSRSGEWPPDGELYETVQEIAGRLYNRFAGRFETDVSTVHRDRYCGYIEPDFKTELDCIGLGVIERIRRVGDVVHRFVETLDGIIMDPTWQQFVDPEHLSPDLPKVLFGTREQIMDYLRRLGLEDRIGGIWRDTEDDSTVPRHDDATNDSDDEGWGWRGAEPREEGYDGSEEWPDLPGPTAPPGPPAYRPSGSYDYIVPGGSDEISVRGVALTLASIVEDFPIGEMVDAAAQTSAMARKCMAEAAAFASEHVDSAIHALGYVAEYTMEAAAQITAAGEEVGLYLSHSLVSTNISIDPPNPYDYYDQRATQEHLDGIDQLVARIRVLANNALEKLSGIMVTTGQTNNLYVANAERYTLASVDTLENCILLLQAVKEQMQIHYAKKAEYEEEQRRQGESG